MILSAFFSAWLSEGQLMFEYVRTYSYVNFPAVQDKSEKLKLAVN